MSLIPRVAELRRARYGVQSASHPGHARDLLLSFVSVRKYGRITRAYRATLAERNGMERNETERRVNPIESNYHSGLPTLDDA